VATAALPGRRAVAERAREAPVTVP